MNNPPAFPTPAGHATVKDYQPGVGEYSRTVEICQTGMTLRDYFAAKAMTGSLAAESHVYYFQDQKDDSGATKRTRYQIIAEEAYKIADAMLAAREKIL